MDEITPGMIKITVGAEEKVGLKDYSNVVVGPIIISRLIEDGDDNYVKEELRKNLRLIEDLMSEEREEILAVVQESKK